jgi:hypothetical protein
MAILKKRTSSKQLPEARGLDRAPLSSMIRDAEDRPSISSGRAPSITSTGGTGGSNTITSTGGSSSGVGALTSGTSTNRPTLTSTSTKPLTSAKPLTTSKPLTTTKPPVTTKPTVTTKPPVTTKPAITTKTTTPTKTTPTSVVKPTVTKPVTNTNTLGNKVTNALTGAVIGAGTKLLFDKITGKPVVTNTGGTKQPASGTKSPAGSTKAPASGTKAPAGGAKSPTGGTKPATGGASGLPSATDIYKGTPADESLGLPAGAIDNGDGTYTTVFDDGSSMTYSMEDNSVLYSTDTDGNIDVFEGSNNTIVAGGNDSSEATTGGGGGTRGLGGTTVAENTDTEYYQDGEGNYYTMNEDGEYDLAYYADGSSASDDTSVYGDDTVVAENTEPEYFEDSLGNVYAQNEDGTYELYANADGSEVDDYTYSDDTFLADNTEYTDDSDYLYAGDSNYDSYDYGDYGDYGDYDYAKRGGLITMMKKGGLPKFADGDLVYSDTEEEVQPWQNVSYNYGENDDPNLTGSDSLYSQSGDINNTYSRANPISLSSALGDGEEVVNTSYSGDEFTPVPGRQYFDDGSYIDTFDDGSTMTYDSDGTLVDTTEGYQTTVDDEGNFIVTDGYGNVTVYDPSGELIPAGGGRVTPTVGSNIRTNTNASTAVRPNSNPITNVGGGERTPVVGNVLSEGWDAVSGLGKDALSAITGALGTTAGAAGAGALVATLLGQDFSGGTGAQNQGLDMSQVGLINPRTTDFGIGPTNFVGYDQYGTDDGGYVPNEELLRNLNAPGYNPVREGDYGYEEVPAEASADEALPAMASGGLTSMSTPVSSYYTFGQPADILANLGMRPQPPMNPQQQMPQIGQQKPPQQMQQQGLPQQMPPQMAQQAPQGMPQQGMMPQQQGMPPPMRKGGLPHVSNVPLVQGRMDFRKGSAVHGAGDGQSDDIPAMLADGEYVIDAETVAQIGNGSTKAGAQALDKFREGIRAHKRSAPINKIPPKTKALTSYLKGAK